MKRILAVVFLASLLAAGCGVKQEIYQEEVLRARNAEASSEDLSIQLENARKKTAVAEGEIATLKVKIAEVEKELDLAKKSTGETGERLGACQREREEALAALDAAKKTILDGDREARELRARIEKQKAEAEVASRSCDERVESVQALMEKARGRITSMEAERSVLLEEKERLKREKEEKVEEISETYKGLIESMKAEMEKTYTGLLEDMKSEIEKGQITISNLKGRLTVNVVDEILFPSGSSVVKEEGKAVLKKVGDALASAYDKAVIIEGHTDNVPIGGALATRFPTNWELSTARAVSVVRFLAAETKISPVRLSAVGYGENRPVMSNDTPEGKAKNRRIEIKLVPLEPEYIQAPPAPQEQSGGDAQAGSAPVPPAEAPPAAPADAAATPAPQQQDTTPVVEPAGEAASPAGAAPAEGAAAPAK
jgi:chemotaxis protein MotB